MAYGHSSIGGISNPPTIDNFTGQLADLAVEHGENVEVGMTVSGQVVTKASLERQTGGWTGWFRGGESFEKCQEHLQEYLAYHSNQKKLADRKVEVVAVGPSPILSKAHRLGALLQSAERLPYKDSADIYPDQASNRRVRGAERIRAGDATKLVRLMCENQGLDTPDDPDINRTFMDLIRQLYRFDQEKTVDLRDFLLTHDMEVVRHKENAREMLNLLLVAFNSQGEGEAGRQPEAREQIDPQTGMRRVIETDSVRPRQRPDSREAVERSQRAPAVGPDLATLNRNLQQVFSEPWGNIDWKRASRLIEAGADPSLRFGKGSYQPNPVFLAVADYSNDQNLRMLGDPHEAERLECLAAMLRHPSAGRALSQVDDGLFGNTSLCLAIAVGDRKAAAMMTDKIMGSPKLRGLLVKPNEKTHPGILGNNTPLVLAMKTDDQELAGRLLPFYSGHDLLAHKTAEGHDALELACYGRFNDLLPGMLKVVPEHRVPELTRLYQQSDNHRNPSYDVDLYEDDMYKGPKQGGGQNSGRRFPRDMAVEGLMTARMQAQKKEALADRVGRARALSAEALRKSSQGIYKEAFLVYRDVVVNCSRDENPVEYDMAVRGMADIWLEAGALPDDTKSQENRSVLVTHMTRLAATDEIIHHQLGLITPKAAPRQSRRPSPPEPVSRPPQEAQRPRTQNRPSATPVEPMQMNRHRLFEYELDGKMRLADKAQRALQYPEVYGVDDKRVVNRVTDEQVRMLEYRVVDDHQEVRRKIERANHAAVDHQRTQNQRDEKYHLFEPGRTLGMAEAREIHGFHSQAGDQLQGAGLATAAGDRGINEDAHLITRFEFRAGNERIPVALAGVFDGHGGILPRAETEGGKYYSDRVADNLVAMAQKRLEQYNEGGLTEAGIWNALKLAMVDLGRMGMTEQGSTACVVLTIKDRLWTVNVGDSRAMLELPEGGCLQLSEDQIPDGAERGTRQIPGKYARSSIKRGGEPDDRRMRGPQRSGSLGPARSMGEHLLQGTISSRGKITSQPITNNIRQSNLMIGCDGVFDVATSEQVIQLMRTQRQINPRVTNEELAAEIVAHAFAAKSLDNLSAMVIPVASMLAT